MVSSTVIRIDREVLAELQRRAKPLGDTPNSVLRRVFNLQEPEPKIDPRVGRLRDLVQDLVGQTVRLQRDERGYIINGPDEHIIAHMRTKKERLTVAVRKEDAGKAGIDDWVKERRDRLFGCVSARWYIQDGDEAAYKPVAAAIARLWTYSLTVSSDAKTT